MQTVVVFAAVFLGISTHMCLEVSAEDALVKIDLAWANSGREDFVQFNLIEISNNTETDNTLDFWSLKPINNDYVNRILKNLDFKEVKDYSKPRESWLRAIRDVKEFLSAIGKKHPKDEVVLLASTDKKVETIKQLVGHIYRDDNTPVSGCSVKVPKVVKCTERANDDVCDFNRPDEENGFPDPDMWLH